MNDIEATADEAFEQLARRLDEALQDNARLAAENERAHEQLLEIHRVTSCVAVPLPVRDGDWLTTWRVKNMAALINYATEEDES
ncbi:MAG TPA: hypothetical protein VFM75_10850 [Modicisalibacter sp.]|nr:hypothetical protein [Modicisalibacter sp.]